MLLSQMQNIRFFVEKRLGDMVKWGECAFPRHLDGTTNMGNADRAEATIPIGDKRFRVLVTGTYVDPPIGKIFVYDEDGGVAVSGNKNDDTWDKAAKHMRAGGKLLPLVEAPPLAIIPPPEPEPLPADGRIPYLAMPALFVCPRNGEIGGMAELAAIVTKVVSPTVVHLTVFPRNSEFFCREELPRRSEKHQHSCWDFAQPLPPLMTMMSDMAAAEKKHRKAS